MQCEQAQAALALAGYGEARPPELDAHLASCERCRAHARANAALDGWLARAETLQPGPGFDTRFFARLDAERARTSSRLRLRALRLGWLLVPAAAAAATVLWLRHPPAAPVAEQPLPPAAELPADELALAMDLEMVEDLEVVQKLDELEAYEVLSQLDDAELDAILAEDK